MYSRTNWSFPNKLEMTICLIEIENITVRRFKHLHMDQPYAYHYYDSSSESNNAKKIEAKYFTVSETFRFETRLMADMSTNKYSKSLITSSTRPCLPNMYIKPLQIIPGYKTHNDNKLITFLMSIPPQVLSSQAIDIYQKPQQIILDQNV